MAAIILWNTVYLDLAVQLLRDSGELRHLSPLGWEHINLTGDYSWNQDEEVQCGGFRALRIPSSPVSLN